VNFREIFGRGRPRDRKVSIRFYSDLDPGTYFYFLQCEGALHVLMKLTITRNTVIISTAN